MFLKGVSPPKPAAIPVAHSIVKNGGVAGNVGHHTYVPPDINVGTQVQKE